MTSALTAKYFLFGQLIFSAIAFSLTGALLRFAAEAGSPYWATMAVRSVVTGILLMLVTRRRPIWTRSTIISALLINAQFLLFTAAVPLVNPGMVSFLSYTSLLWVPLLVIFTGSGTVTLRSIAVSVGLLFSSSVFFFDHVTFQEHLGLVLALGAGMIWSVALVFTATREHETDSSVLDIFIAAAMMLGGISAVLSFAAGTGAPPARGIAWASAGGIQAALALGFFARPLRLLDTTVVNMGLFTFDPTLAAVWAMLFFRTMPSKWAILGGTSIILILILNSGLALLEQRSARKREA